MPRHGPPPADVCLLPRRPGPHHLLFQGLPACHLFQGAFPDSTPPGTPSCILGLHPCRARSLWITFMGPEPASCGFPEPSECWQPPVCVGEGYAGDSAGKLCFFLSRSVSSRKVQEPARPIPHHLPSLLGSLSLWNHVLNSSYTNIKKLSPSLLSPHRTDPLKAKPWPSSPQNPLWLPPHPSKSQRLYYRGLQNFLPLQFLTSTHSRPAMLVSRLPLQDCSCLRALLFACWQTHGSVTSFRCHLLCETCPGPHLR